MKYTEKTETKYQYPSGLYKGSHDTYVSHDDKTMGIKWLSKEVGYSLMYGSSFSWNKGYTKAALKSTLGAEDKAEFIMPLEFIS